jgi:hypothetical protein
MHAMLCRTTDVELELDNLVSIDDDYKTAPMLAITLLPPLRDEEELHMQFEAALCERITMFDGCLHYVRDAAWYAEASSISLLSSPLTTLTTEPLSEMAIAETSSAHTNQIHAPHMLITQQKSSGFWNHRVQSALIYCCCALSCILLGFDMMGLLILHTR